MSLNAYIPKDNGDLKHVAEADGTLDQLPEFVEAMQEALRGQQKDGPFVVLDIDSGTSAYVEFEEEPVTTVTRVLKVNGEVVNNGSGEVAQVTPPKRATRTVKKAPAKAGTAKRTVKKAPAVKTATRKAAPKKAAPKAAAKKTIKGSGFKRNPASAES